MSGMGEKTVLRYIMLSQMQGFGPVGQNALLDICGTIDRCFESDRGDIISASNGRLDQGKIDRFVTQRDRQENADKARKVLREAKIHGIDILVRENPDFPDRFKGLPDMPILLYGKGRLKINGTKAAVGIVGARRCSSEGKEKAIALATEAVAGNAAVVSGMAKGIDAYAHTAAIKHHGYTIAVLGNGADICYPAEHARLYEAIVDTGCILSEYPPGTPPRAYLFPRRNRLIAALSDELYVVEAGQNSGTRSTLEHSLQYGRKAVRC